MRIAGKIAVVSLLAVMGCSEKDVQRTMVIIAPGHYHAALIQKNTLEGVYPVVEVYGPAGPDLDSYLSVVESFNSREDSPTAWVEDIHYEEDEFPEIPPAGRGDFVVLSGNNHWKARRILRSVKKGYNVLSDKPMAISPEDYDTLRAAYSLASEKGLVVYDLMTERFDALNMLSRELVSDRDFFGEVEKVSISSVHHFYKNVAGAALKRPGWYYDVNQQGEGIADVTTHLVDQVFWLCFPGEEIGVSEVNLLEASHYPTPITREEYRASTGEEEFPDYLHGAVKDGVLQVMSNGEMLFTVKGVPARISVRWDYEAPPGGGDTSESLFVGSKAEVRIVQDESTLFSRRLLVLSSREAVDAAAERLRSSWPSVSFLPLDEGIWEVRIPDEEKTGHEDHFSMVARAFLACLDSGAVSRQEVEGTLAKYYLTTSAVGMARR